MCGIMGVVGETSPETLYKLAMVLKVRGLHAFGLSFYGPDGILTEKSSRPFRPPAFAEAMEYLPRLIYHNRYSTSGDYRIEQNNQPIQTGSLSVAMNGVISMKPRQEYEAEYQVKCETDNDAEILNRLIERGEDLAAIFNKSTASVSSVWLRKKKVFGYTNGKRPLHYIKDRQVVIAVSTRDAIQRAIDPVPTIYDFPVGEVVDLEALIC